MDLCFVYFQKILVLLTSKTCSVWVGWGCSLVMAAVESQQLSERFLLTSGYVREIEQKKYHMKSLILYGSVQQKHNEFVI